MLMPEERERHRLLVWSLITSQHKEPSHRSYSVLCMNGRSDRWRLLTDVIWTDLPLNGRPLLWFSFVALSRPDPPGAVWKPLSRLCSETKQEMFNKELKSVFSGGQRKKKIN